MRKIPLRDKQDRVRAYAFVDNEDYERVSMLRWHIQTSNKNAHYAAHCTRIPRPEGATTSVIFLHNFIMGFKGVDHRNGNGLDCRKLNLRKATISQNRANIGKLRNNTSGYKGVYFYKPSGKWNAQCQNKTLRSFDSPLEAAKAYDGMAFAIYGSFARTNFPIQRFPRYRRFSRLAA